MTRPATSYGRYQTAESTQTLRALHIHSKQELRAVDSEPLVGVLDQSDLFAQGIDTSQVVKGAARVDALGSCTANATTVALSNVMPQDRYKLITGVENYEDVVGAEKWAIGFYHGCTDQTAEPSTEWPPTDCGSSGPYIVQYAQRLGIIRGATIAKGPDNIVSLMQSGGLIVGQPFFNAWEEPDADGFVDSGGLQAAIDSGVAGGHETYLSAVEKLELTETGMVIPDKTIIRFRNSWSKAWGDHGSYRARLSTYVALETHCDFRQLLPVR